MDITFIINIMIILEEATPEILPFKHLIADQISSLSKAIEKFFKVNCKRLQKHTPQIFNNLLSSSLRYFVKLGQKYFECLTQTIDTYAYHYQNRSFNGNGIEELFQKITDQNKQGVYQTKKFIEERFRKNNKTIMKLFNQKDLVLGEEEQFKPIFPIGQQKQSNIQDPLQPDYYLKDLEMLIQQQSLSRDHQIKKKIKQSSMQAQFKITDVDIHKNILNVQQQQLINTDNKSHVQEIQERSQLNTCLLHNLMFYYKSIERYYCNECVMLLSKKNKPQQQKIRCIKHEQQIIYMKIEHEQVDQKLNRSFQSASEDTQTTSLAQTQKKKEISKQQQYFCYKCRQLQHPQQNQNVFTQYILLSTCHYLPLHSLCQNTQCIDNNNFDVCTKCVALKLHQEHSAISTHNFKEVFFSVRPSIMVQKYQQNVVRTKSRLNLQLMINKMISQHMQKMSPFLFHINSFIDHENIQQLTNLVIQKRDRNAFNRLINIEKIFKMNLNEEERLAFLEVYQYLLVKKLTETYQHINLSIGSLCDYTPCLTNLASDEIQSIFLEKYETIIIKNNISYYYIDNQIEQMVPKKQFLPIIAKKIIINQTNNSNNLQNLSIQRKKLFRNLSYQILFSQRNKDQILLYISNLQSINCEQYSQLQMEKIDHYKDELSKIQNEQGQDYQNNCLLYQLVSMNWQRLKIIDIKYSQSIWMHSQIKIPAFDIFKIVKNIPQIEMINIEGVTIDYFDKFMRNLRIYSQQLKDQCLDESPGIIQWLIWFQSLQFQRRIKMSINIELYYFFKHAEIVRQKIKDLQLLLKYIDLSDIKFMICLQKCQRADQLSLLLQNIHKMKKVRIFIGPLNYEITNLTERDPFYHLIQYLSKFNSIVQLQIKYIYLQLQSAQQNIIENLFNSIFQNNQILTLIINNCNGFPSLKLNTLQTVKILYSRFRYKFVVKQIIENNPNLKYIQLVYHQRRLEHPRIKLYLKNLNHLRHLHIKYCEFFDDDSLNSLTSSSCSTLQSLTIWINKEDKNLYLKKISKYSLQQIFPLLNRVQSINLSNIDFSASIFLSIPSMDLKQLCIQGNDEINDLGLNNIGSRWTNLIQLRLVDCKRITKFVFQNWTFNYLALLKMDQSLLKDEYFLVKLVKQGVKVSFYKASQTQIIFRDFYSKDAKKEKEKQLKNNYEIDSIFWPSDAFLQDLKCLGLQRLTLGNKENKLVSSKSLQKLLPQLNNLKYLCLWTIDFEGQLLLNIPSFELTYMHIFHNNIITNQNLLRVGRGLTNLKSFTIYDCIQIHGNFLLQFKFRALQQLTVNQHILQQSQQIIQRVKIMRSSGLTINSYFQKSLLKAFETIYQQVRIKAQTSQNINVKQQQLKQIKKQLPQIDISTNKEKKQVNNNNQNQNAVIEQKPKNPYLKKKQIQMIQISPDHHLIEQKNSKYLTKCRKHEQQIYYSFDQDAGYCNECIQQKKYQKLQSSSSSSSILCKKHNKIIKFKFTSKDSIKKKIIKIGQTHPQYYLCTQCYKSLEQPEKNAKLILGCHFQQVKQMCTNLVCIQKGTYLICQICNYLDHQNHQKIVFEKSVLQSYGYSKIQLQEILPSINQYKQQSTKKPLIYRLQNLIDDQAKKISIFKQFLQFFEVNKQNQIQLVIESLLSNEQNNKPILFWSLSKIKGQLKKLNKQQSKVHLKNIQEIFLDIMSKYLTLGFNQINELHNNLQIKFQTILCSGFEQLNMKINNKYETISITEKQQAQITSLSLLSDEIHIKRMKNLMIEVEVDQFRGIQLKQQKRAHLFNNQIWNIFDHFNVSSKQRHKIRRLFLEYEQANQLPQQYENINNIFLEFKQKLLEIEQQYQKNFEIFPLFQLMNKGNEHLVNLVITCSFQHNNSKFYQIQAISLFKMIGLNKKLKKISINGVYVKDLQEFIKCFMAHKDKYLLKYEQDKKLLSDYIFWDKSDIICMTKYPPEDLQYLNELDLQDLQININARIIIKHQSSPFKTSHKLRNIASFLALFKSIEGIQLKFDLYGIINLDKILKNIIKMVKSIKLHITCKKDIQMITNYDTSYLIFQLLRQLDSTHITSIIFQNVKFRTKNIQLLSEIRDNIQKIIQRNTLYLKNVKLINCIRFPSFSTLQVPMLCLDQSTLSSGNAFDQQPINLNLLPFYPQNLYLKNFFFMNNGQILTKNRLRTLKQLTLVNVIPNDNAEKHLKDLFSNLSVLSNLCLKGINIQGQLLEISSPFLRRIQLFDWNFSYNEQIVSIDARWPHLMEIIINECKNITAVALSKCKLTYLYRISLSQKLYRQCKGMIIKLKRNGTYARCIKSS